MKKNLLNELDRLRKAEVINNEVLESIKAFYAEEQSKSNNRLYTVFSIFGACLIGLGIILLIAHNWDDLSRITKTILAILPLVFGQGVGFYVMRKKSSSKAWTEGSSSFLFFAIGASIALISQIYNIPGNLGNYLFTWMILSLPIIYLLKSSMVSLLYLLGISWFVGEAGYWGHSDTSEYFYWLLLFAILPDYYQLIKNNPKSNFTKLYNWFVPASVTFSLGLINSGHEEWLFVAYLALFCMFYLIGSSKWIAEDNPRVNPFKIIGSLGSVIILLILSFEWLWDDLERGEFDIIQIASSQEFILTLVLSVLILLLYRKIKSHETVDALHPLNLLYLLFFFTFILGFFNAFAAQVLINVFAFGLGLYYILTGSRAIHLTQLNFGLLIITALIICRFFDSNITFIIRGLLFIVIGVGFFMLNYRLLKKRQNEE